MSSPGDDLVLEHLRHIRTAVDETRHDIREIKARVGTLEQQYANMSNRIDRIEFRLERIETRIGVIDA